MPDLLTAQFDEHLTGDGPAVEITEPVRLTVRLGDLGSSLRGTASASFVIEPAPATDPVPVPVAEAAQDSLSTEEAVLVGHATVAATPAELFAELAERGELAALLALLPNETLRRYVLRVARRCHRGTAGNGDLAAGR